MDNSQITLNGKDWSNLYLVDYPGGAGGEMFVSLLSDLVGTNEFTNKKTDLYSTVTDSCGNGLASYFFPKYIFTMYGVSTPEECRYDLVTTTKILKTIIYFWQKSNKFHDNAELIADLELQNGIDKTIKKIENYEIKNPVVIRGHHRPLEFEKLKNAKILRLYPSTLQGSKLTYTRMLLLKWLSFYSLRNLNKMPKELKELAYEQNGKVFSWQAENYYKDRFHWTFHDFVKSVYSVVESDFTDIPNHIDFNKNVIDCNNWLFDELSVDDVKKFESVTGLEYKENDEIKKWRENNINLLKEENLDPTKDYDIQSLHLKVLKKYKKLCTQLR